MRRHKAAEWVGFAAGFAVAVLVWIWGHAPWAAAEDNGSWGMQNAQGYQTEQSERMKNNGQWEQRNGQTREISERTETVFANVWRETGERSVAAAAAGGNYADRSRETDQMRKADKMRETDQMRKADKMREADKTMDAAEAEKADKTPKEADPVKADFRNGTDLPGTVRVYLTEEKRVETVPLEVYVRGVVAAEMPADFHPEALKAQALAARTYIVRRIMKRDRTDVPVPDADVTDSQTHQVYRSLREMNRLRESDEEAWRKYHQAAYGTAGRIITYQGEPIQALYFAASNGYTENSEDVFSHRIPYLRSVDSPWDLEHALGSSETVTLPLKEFYEKLGVRVAPAFAAVKGYPAPQVKEWTQGRRVKTLALGGKMFSGTEIRSRLGLKSAAFSLHVKDGQIAITTVGSGHGVGMSQWGAEGMARAGYAAEEIIAHYYPGTELSAES